MDVLWEDLLSELGGEGDVLKVQVEEINEQSKMEQGRNTEWYFKMLSHHAHPSWPASHNVQTDNQKTTDFQTSAQGHRDRRFSPRKKHFSTAAYLANGTSQTQIIQLKQSWLSQTLRSRNDQAGENFYSHKLTLSELC